MAYKLPGCEHVGTDDNGYFGDTNLGMPFNTMFKLIGKVGVGPMNAHVDRIREA